MKKILGFTLLELMVALVLLSLLAGLIFSGFRLAGKAWESVGHRSTETLEAMQVQHFLRHLLEQAQHRELWDPAENRIPSLQGTSEALFFIARLPDPRRRGAGQTSWFYLTLDKTAPDHPLLQLKAQPFPQGEDEPSLDWDLLHNNFQTQGLIPPLLELEAESLTLSYLARETDGIPEWQDEWQQEQLPELILIRLNGSRKHADWPPLIVTPWGNVYDIKAPF